MVGGLNRKLLGLVVLVVLAACIGDAPKPQPKVMSHPVQVADGGEGASGAGGGSGQARGPVEPARDGIGGGGAAAHGGGVSGAAAHGGVAGSGVAGGGVAGGGGASGHPVEAIGGGPAAPAVAGNHGDGSPAMVDAGADPAPTMPDAGVDAGNAVPEVVGLVCTDDADCPSGTECNGLWCSRDCDDDEQCGTSPAGLANVCAMAVSGRRVCFPGCATTNDCASYPETTCKALDSGKSVCGTLRKAGHPCSTGADCAAGLNCKTKVWCSPDVCSSDDECGTSRAGKQNRCSLNAENDKICFPGCETDEDCADLKGTACLNIGASGLACARAPKVGTPCRDDSMCGQDYVCIGTRWCSPPTCADDAECGKSPNGLTNRCRENREDERVCFPGCSSNTDCADYPQTACRLATDESGYICTTVRIGARCSADAECAGLSCMGSLWCSPASCASDDDCGVGPRDFRNRCIANTDQDNICFPGCETNADCVAYPGTACLTDEHICASVSSTP